MSSPIIVHDTVKILSETILPQDRSILSYCLGVPRSKVIQWDGMYRAETLTLEDLFTRVLEHWVSRNGETATVTALVTILRENEFMAAADSLCCPSSKRKNFSFGVKKPIINFVGRVSEVEELTKWLQNPTSKAFLISGFGGQGKTELCRRFIQQLTPESTVVTWFRGDDATQLENSLNDCSSSMNLPTKDCNGNPISITILVKNIGNSVSKIIRPGCFWLAVIDNVDEDYKEFIPAVQELLENDAYILVTSRRTNILPADSEFIDLKELKEEDSMAFVNKLLKNSAAENVIELCQALQNHALALQQAVAYIKLKQRELDSAYGIPEYLEVFNQDKEQPHDHQLGLSGYDRTMSKIIDITINKLIETDEKYNEKSLILLQIASNLKPDGIPLGLLKYLFSTVSPEANFDNAKKPLVTICLIHVENEIVSIHRVVQKLSKNKIRSIDSHPSFLDILFQKIDMGKLGREEMRHVAHIGKILFNESENYQEICLSYVGLFKRLFDLLLVREIKEIFDLQYELFRNEDLALILLGEDMQFIFEAFRVFILLMNGEFENVLEICKILDKKIKKDFGDNSWQTILIYFCIAILNFSISGEWKEWPEIFSQMKQKNSKIKENLLKFKESLLKKFFQVRTVEQEEMAESIIMLRKFTLESQQISEQLDFIETIPKIVSTIDMELFELVRKKYDEELNLRLKDNVTDFSPEQNKKASMISAVFLTVKDHNKEVLKLVKFFEEIFTSSYKKKNNDPNPPTKIEILEFKRYLGKEGCSIQ